MVALIFCGDLKYCPYITRYVERLKLLNVEYKVYFWNRGGFQLDLPSNYTFFDSSSSLNKGKIMKMLDFVRFRSWIVKQLNKDKPEKVIALSTLTGVLLGRTLYAGEWRYVFDIRDYSYEHIVPFYHIEKKIIENSVFTAISSKGFKNFLPKHEYVIAHNFNRNDIKEGAHFEKKGGKIHFVWNGVVRYFEFQKQYLDALKNDERFEIIFHGDGPELQKYKDYCQKNGIHNIYFTGTYENNKKSVLLEKADILNNCYGYIQNAGNKLKYAVSNRFYDGMIYHIPQLVEPDGFKPEWAHTLKIGVSFPVSERFADELYDYYHSIDEEEFDYACDNALQSVLKDDDEYIRKIDLFITELL